MNLPAIQLDWSEFKGYLNSNLCPFKQILRNNTYYLYLADGNLIAGCVIPKNGGSDQTDYEANYQSRANVPFPLYSTVVNVRQSAGTAANATIFAMRNPTSSTRVVVIEQIVLAMSFDAGTPLGRSLQRCYITGFSGATPTGGTAQTAAGAASSNAASQVSDIRFLDTGLTTAGISFGNPLAGMGCPASDGSVAPFRFENPGWTLLPGEGLAIRLGVTAVVGQGLTGMILWSER